MFCRLFVRLVYTLCTQRHSCYDQLYKLYGQAIDNFLIENVSSDPVGL